GAPPHQLHHLPLRARVRRDDGGRAGPGVGREGLLFRAVLALALAPQPVEHTASDPLLRQRSAGAGSPRAVPSGGTIAMAVLQANAQRVGRLRAQLDEMVNAQFETPECVAWFST